MSDQAVPGTNDVERMLRGVELFEMLSSEDLARIQAAGEVQVFGPGDVIFEPQDPSDRIHVILAGAVEIVRTTPDHPHPVPVAYISPGEIVGDMALLTGTARRSGGRVPEKAVVWTLKREDFEAFAMDLRGYGMSLAKLFARRLEGFITHMRREDRRKELAGKLAYFDLPIVIQTLVTSNQTGVLTFLDAKAETYARVLLRDGSVERARCGRLEGEEAFYQLFESPEDATFVFRTVAAPDADAISTVGIAPNAMSLLMEALRLVDELPGVRAHLGAEDRTFRTKKRRLVWKDPATHEMARCIHGALRKPGRIEDIRDGVPCSTFRLHEIVGKLEASGQLV